MSKNQTINDALKALFLELGGDSTKLADNQKISDYIDDIAEELGAIASKGATFDFSISEVEGAYQLDEGATYKDIADATRGGRIPVCYNRSTGDFFYPVYVDPDDGQPVITYLGYVGGEIAIVIVVDCANEYITFTDKNN